MVRKDRKTFFDVLPGRFDAMRDQRFGPYCPTCAPFPRSARKGRDSAEQVRSSVMGVRTRCI
eukprot:159278-Rhodomonas_salina.2